MPSSSSFLVVDADPRGRKALQSGFQAAGYESWGASSGEDALALAARCRPRVAVVSSAVDGTTGIELIRRLDQGGSEDERTVQAVLYLGDDEDRREALRAGAGFCLSRPVELRDVITLARLLAEPAVEGQGGSRSIHVRLREVPIHPLVRALVTARRAAVLVCSRGRRFGEVGIGNGSIGWATSGALSGLAALQHLVLWPDGELEVRLGPPQRRRSILVPGSEALAVAARALADFEEQAAQLGGADTVLEQDLARASAEAGAMPREVTALLRLCDGSRMLVDVIEDSPLRMGETIRALSRLRELGIVRKRDGLRPPGERGAAALAAIRGWLGKASAAEEASATSGVPQAELPPERSQRRTAPLFGVKPPEPSPSGPGGVLSSGPLAPLDAVLAGQQAALSVADGPAETSPPQENAVAGTDSIQALAMGGAASVAPPALDELEDDFFSRPPAPEHAPDWTEELTGDARESTASGTSQSVPRRRGWRFWRK